MARKSSKTAHVMNLLAGGESESSKTEAAKENLAASQAAETKGTIKELTVLAQQASIQMQEGPLSPSPISIIDLSSSVPDPVAELIRQQLEEEEDLNTSETTLGEQEEESTLEDLTVEDSIVESMQSEPQMEELENEVEEEIIDEPEIFLEDQTDEVMEPEEESPADAPIEPKPDFTYLNVMEYVVKNSAKDYMERLGGCTCGHCIADVIALTLTKLPPKYVVVAPPTASPLLNFYSNRFSPQVIVELTKSCFIVKENPHH